VYRDPATGEPLCGFHQSRAPKLTWRVEQAKQAVVANMISRYGAEVAAIKLSGKCEAYNADVAAWRNLEKEHRHGSESSQTQGEDPTPGARRR
jgi:beta-mannanase